MSFTTAFQLYSAVIVKSSELWTDVPFRFNEKNDNQQCLLDPPPPRRVMVNKENYYSDYKGDKKWLSLISSHFAKSIIFAMKLCAKYQKDSI